MFRHFIAVFSAVLFLLVTPGVAADTVQGTWALMQSDTPDLVDVTFNRSNSRHHWRSGRSFDASAFQGLDLSNAGRQQISFTLQRDAGNITGDGVVLNRAGSGVFIYTPNADYFRQLNRIGFGGIESEEQWDYAISDVSLDFARGMAKRRIPGLNADELLGFRAVSGDLAFVDDLREAGIEIEDADNLIAFRVHDVTPDFIRAVRAKNLSPDNDQLIAMQIHDVTPDYIDEIQAAGFSTDVEDLIAFRIHDVTPEFAREVKKLGFTADADELTALRIHDVTPDFIKGMQAEFRGVELDDIISASIHDVTLEDVRAIRALKLSPTLEQMISMAIHEVTPAYIADLRSKGVTTNDIDKFVSLKIHGVD